MGLFSVTVKIANPVTPNVFQEAELLVDTRATFSFVPDQLLRDLEVRPLSRRKFVCADGRKIERPTGGLIFEYDGTPAVAPVVFGEAQDTPLLGATTLEALGLLPDVVQKRLVPTRLLAV